MRQGFLNKRQETRDKQPLSQAAMFSVGRIRTAGTHPTRRPNGRLFCNLVTCFYFLKNQSDAIAAPSASDFSFSQATPGSIAAWPT